MGLKASTEALVRRRYEERADERAKNTQASWVSTAVKNAGLDGKASYATLKATADKSVEEGGMREDERQDLLDSAKILIDEQALENRKDRFTSDLEQMAIDKGLPTAVRWGNATGRAKEYGIDPADTERATNILENRVTEKTAREKDQLEKNIAAERKDMEEKIIIPRNYTDVEKTLASYKYMSVEEKDQWRSKFRTRAKAKIEDKPDPFEESDPDVYNPLYYRMATAPKTFSDDLTEVSDLLGAGISIANFEKLQEMKAKGPDSPLTKKSIVRAHTRIVAISKEMEKLAIAKIKEENDEDDARQLIIDKVRELQYEQQRDQDDLDTWAQNNPKDTDDPEKVQKKTQSLTRAKEDVIVVSFLESFAALIPRKHMLPVKKLNRLKELGLWDSWNQTQRDWVKQKIDSGSTVEDILQAWEAMD